MRWVLICIHFIPKLSIFARNFIFQSETSNLPLLNSPVGSDQFLPVYVYTQIVGPFASNVVSLTCHHTSYIIILFSYILMFGFISPKKKDSKSLYQHFFTSPSNLWSILPHFEKKLQIDVVEPHWGCGHHSSGSMYTFVCGAAALWPPAFIGGSEERVEGIALLPPRKMNESTCSNHQFSWDKSL